MDVEVDKSQSGRIEGAWVGDREDRVARVDKGCIDHLLREVFDKLGDTLFSYVHNKKEVMEVAGMIPGEFILSAATTFWLSAIAPIGQSNDNNKKYVLDSVNAALILLKQKLGEK